MSNHRQAEVTMSNHRQAEVERNTAETKITVRVNPHILEDVTAELRILDPDLAARVHLVPTDAMPRGDARIAWENGAAARDTASLWSQIESILTGIGPLNTEQSTEG